MNFEDVVKKFKDDAIKKATYSYRRATELIGEELANTKPNGGDVPFLTGNLARSLAASKEQMPRTAEGPFKGEPIGLVTNSLELGDSIWFGYQAIYARRQNYGFVGSDSLGRVYNQAGNYFVEKAIAKWPVLVNKAVEEFKE